MDVFSDLMSYAANWRHLLAHYSKLFKLEAKLAKMSLGKIVIILFMILALAMFAWINILVLIGYGLFLLSKSIWIALTIPFVVNLLLIIFCVFYAFKLSKYLKFTRLKASLHQFKTEPMHHDNLPIKKAD